MSGSLGGGQSRSSQNSQSSGYQTSQQSSTSQSQAQSSESIAYADLYSQLYGNATGAASNAAANAGDLNTAAQQLFTGGTQYLQSLGQDSGSQYLESRLSDDNEVLNEQIAQLQEDTGRLFSEELNPAITSRAVSGGTLGGGRQGVAQGLAAESAARTFTEGVTTLRSNDIAARDAAAQSVATNSLNAASTGLGSLSSLLDVLQTGSNAELDVYSSLSSILGGPTTLTESSSTSTAESLAQAYGEEQSTSSGRSRAWNFDSSFSAL